MQTLIQVLTERDDMTRAQAKDAITDARIRVKQGEDPEEILREEFGLEPDYIFELL